MDNGHRYAVFVFSVLLTISVCVTSSAQTPLPIPPANPAGQSDTPEPEQSPASSGSDLTTLRNRVTQSQLPDEEKAALTETISQAEASLAGAASLDTAAAEFQKGLQTLDQRAQQIKEQLEELKDFKPTGVADSTLEQLEAMLPPLTSQLATAKADLATAETAAALASERRQEIEALAPTVEQNLADRRTQIEASPTGTVSLAEETKREKTVAEEKQLAAQLSALRNEAALIDAESAAGLAQLNRDLLAGQVETLQIQMDAVQAAIATARAEDAAARVQSAESSLDSMHPALRPIGEQNQEYANTNQELAAKIESLEIELDRATEQLESVRQSFQQAKTRVDTVGLTEAVGSMLRTLKANLPSIREYQIGLRERQPLINNAQFTLIELTDQRNARVSQTIQTLFLSAEPPVPLMEQDVLDDEARQLLENQRGEFLDPLIRSQSSYFNSLVSLSTTEQQIIDLVQEATEYANQRVLWVRSTRPLLSKPIPNQTEWWFLLPGAWSRLVPELFRDFTTRWVRWSLAALALLALIRFRSRLRKEIEEIGQQVSRGSFTDFRPTVHALVMTAATAGPVTLALAFLGSRLKFVAGVDPVSLGVSNALIAGAMVYFPLEVLRQICRPNGVAAAHFGRNAENTRFLRDWLRRLMWILIPLVLVTTFLRSGGRGFGNDVLERYFFLAASIVIAVMLAKLMSPKHGIPRYYLLMHPSGWVSRLAYVWYVGVVAIPLLIGFLATIGYYFTARALGWRMYQTIILVMIAGLVVLSLTRWVLLRRRQFMIDEARAKREQEKAPVEDAGAEFLASIGEDDAVEEMRQQMSQTRRLLAVVMASAVAIGLWAVWSDVLTARVQLEKYPLWKTTTTETETKADPNGEAVTVTKTVIDNVTVFDVAFAVLVVAITVLATRNIPGLLEFALLKKLPLDSSVRYAISSLASYAIALVGLIVSGQAIGLHWEQIQWMATALTFGLAFGLQEMFANFIAGVIILFEQPVRVGDIVEIDGVTGVVSRIRIRATTITDWNRKDYIVPNKEFITGKILNWTKSDPTSRIVVTVGVAYGSDTERVRELLIQSAAEQENILEDPGPSATFEGFGDNALNFVLRCYVATPSVMLGTTHNVHTAIDQAFRREGIEISFPQQDLYLRGIPQSVERFLQKDSNKTVPQSQMPRGEETKESDDNSLTDE